MMLFSLNTERKSLTIANKDGKPDTLSKKNTRDNFSRGKNWSPLKIWSLSTD